MSQENVQNVAETTARKNVKKFEKKTKGNVKPNYCPQHVWDMYLILANNSEIRRFTSHAVINYLLQKGEITGTKRYVEFKETKFKVWCDGLCREFHYKEPFFIKAILSSFTSFAATAQRTIADFTAKEINAGLTDITNNEEINDISMQVLGYNENEAEDVVEDKPLSQVEHD